MREAARYEHDGKSMTLGQWAKSMGTSTKTLHRRLECGWPLERVLTEPVKSKVIKPEGYWQAKIMELDAVKSGEVFTLSEIARTMKTSAEALESHFTVLRRQELFTELPSVNSKGTTYMKFRLRANCSEVLKQAWRKTNNDWLGLEPRIGVQW